MLDHRKAYVVLAEREARRMELSQSRPRYPSPEHIYYSVQKSLSHRTSNRYSNILAYDRTAVSADGEYLNANVVCDGKGGCWVAAQVSGVEDVAHVRLPCQEHFTHSLEQSILGQPRHIPARKRSPKARLDLLYWYNSLDGKTAGYPRPTLTYREEQTRSR
jgi:hypothetical protein